MKGAGGAVDIDAGPPLDGGRYRLIRVLGAGGMATVYEAYDSRLDVRRAIKVLDPAMFARARIRARFDAEARTMARLVHPHICTVHDVGVDGDRAFIAMEFVEGGTLQDRVERGDVTPAQAVRWMIDVLEALGAAHAAGVVHRDLKPHNVLLTRDGVVRLGDFGIAQLADPERSSLTRAGAVLGTPAFMPPEQKADSRSVGPAADVYAAGATLFALVTGKEPFDLYAHDAKVHLLPLVPEPLAPIIDRATRYQPGDRFPSAESMRAALIAALAALGAGAVARPVPAVMPPPSPPTVTFALEDEPELVQPPRPRRAVWFGVAGTALLLATAVGAPLFGSPPAPDTAPSVAPMPAAPAAPAEAVAAPPPVAPPDPAPSAAPAVDSAPPRPRPADVPLVALPASPLPAPAPETEPEPEPEPEPAPAAAGPTVGLRLASTLPATVAIDGAVVGKTPYAAEVSVGRHQVTLAPETGGTAFVRTFTFDAGRAVSYCHDFEAERPCK